MNTSNLNAKDLMVGDWVSLSKGNWSENRQVELIDIEMIAESVYFAAPITLTPEILEKNGFRIIFEGELHTTYFQDIEGFHVEIKIDCINYIKLSMLNGFGYNITIECKFVHQLQHALRLCGIDKEIIL